MLKRKMYDELLSWKDTNKALLVTGARQVGKTYIIREFGKNNFESFIEINLYDNPNYIKLLDNVKSANEFLLRISTITTSDLIENDTLIFIDEIQYAKNCDLITLSKFLVTDGKYKYIFSGSMLGVELNNVVSWPTGYMKEIRMYPMDFEEFLWALRLDKKVIEYLEECFNNKTKVDDLIHERIINAFYQYLLVGGMPEAVKAFIDTNNIKKVNEVQSIINEYYRKDILQYATSNKKVHYDTIYKSIPQELNKKNKRFSLSSIGDQYSIKNIEDDFMWLSQAGVCYPTYNCQEPICPLALNANNRLVKLFHSDCGLLCNMLMDTDVQIKLLTRDLNINYGALFENVVSQELSSHGYNELYYFNSKKQGEVDFLIEYKGNVLPIEVKNGKDYTKHSALNNLLNNSLYEISNAFVFSNNNVSSNGKIIYLPIYMIMFLKRNKSLDVNLSFDLSDVSLNK